MTPQEFARRYVDRAPATTTCASCTTRAKTSPVGRTFTVEYLGNVVDGAPVTYLNVDIAR